MTNKDRLAEEIKKMPTHYWIMKETGHGAGEWNIIRLNDSNIHLINDPKSFGCRVIPIPPEPIHIWNFRANREPEKKKNKWRQRLLGAFIGILIAVTFISLVQLVAGILEEKAREEIREEHIPIKEIKNVTIASWYDYTLNGIAWSRDHLTAASREFTRGTIVEVKNIATGNTVNVMINDYGPDEELHPDRLLDLSSYAFKEISSLHRGVIEVEYREIGQGEYYPIN